MPTPLQGFRYPAGTDANNVPTHMQNLALDAERRAVQIYTSVADRTARFATAGISPTEGMVSYLQDLDRLDVYNGTVWAPAAGRVECRLRRAAAQSLTTGVAASVSWDTEDADPYSFITTPGTQLAVPTGLGGEYAITFKAIVAALTGAARHAAILILANGTSTLPAGVDGIHRVPISIDEDIATLTVIAPLAAGNTIEAQILQSSGGSLNGTAWLNVVRLGS